MTRQFSVFFRYYILRFLYVGKMELMKSFMPGGHNTATINFLRKGAFAFRFPSMRMRLDYLNLPLPPQFHFFYHLIMLS